MYYNQLIKLFDFSEDVAFLIRSLYNKINTRYSLDNEIVKAWCCARLLGGLVYGNESSNLLEKLAWKDVGGKIFYESELDYFINELYYSKEEYERLKAAISYQHSYTPYPDFAHMQISLAARLAYYLDYDGDLSNISLYSDEEISYLAGWFGDAILCENNGTTSFSNDDYCADLDAENIYRIIIEGKSSIDAINEYYMSLSNSNTRANVFLTHLSYQTVKNMVFDELIDKKILTLLSTASENGDIFSVKYYNDLLNDDEYHWNTLKSSYKNTYNFLMSLDSKLSTLSQF